VTEYERNIRRGLQSVRRVARRADSQGERLDRWLKRQTSRKTAPKRRVEVQPGIDAFYQYKKAVDDLEQAFAKDYVSYIE